MSAESIHRYSIAAAPEPSVLPRALELFAKRGLIPARIEAKLLDGRMTIEIEASGLDSDTARHIGRCLAGLIDVERVLAHEHLTDQWAFA